MNGVEILSKQLIYETEAIPEIFFIVLSLGIITGIIMAIVEWVDMGFSWDVVQLFFVCATLGFLCGIMGLAMSAHKTDEVDYIEYKVTIDDSVSMTEFMDKYEILDQEGKIYTVKERE